MVNEASVAPVMITHWDPDLYPAKPAPGIQELVVYVLISKVLLKEVDLLLNPKIRAAFEDPAIVRQFASLLDTGRIKVLLPPLSTDFSGIDPRDQPMTAVARERDRKRRPLKSKVRKLTRADERYCADLDSILMSAGAIEFRKEFPAENDFARTLAAVLSNPDQGWRQRCQFSGIDQRMADTFVGYCEDPSKAVAALPQHILPNAQDFYRSLGYQVADVYPDKNRRRPMKNLLQSVYAHCELNREGARGTYWGKRVAELPPTSGDSTHDDILGLEELPPLDPVAQIPVAENIGDIVARVLEECAPMPALTDMKAEPATIADKWAHVADAFARYSVHIKPVTWSPKAQHRWNCWGVASHHIRFGFWVLEGTLFGAQFVSTFEHLPVHGALWASHGLTYCAKPVVEWIRRGRAYDDRDTERARVRRVVLDALTVRVGDLIDRA